MLKRLLVNAFGIDRLTIEWAKPAFALQRASRELRGCHGSSSGRRAAPACWSRLPARTNFFRWRATFRVLG